MSNPFKIIEPTEEAPTGGRKEILGSVSTVVLILRFVQLFMADSTAVALNQFKIDLDKKSTDTKDD